APEVLAKYEPVIGLEVHVQLLTRTKIFCGCSTRFGDPPNTNVCPVCLGLPGTLPVLNKRAVEMAMRAALALNCTVHEHSRFARKNYFYPDLPKGYQISQYELPLATGGWLEVGGAKKRIGITRLHLEEDAAKNLHEGFSQSATKAYIDYNRCGTPLSEIVSEPDMRTPEEAYAYLTALRQIMLYTGVSDGNMEEGSLRCDANVSVRPRGAKEFGTKVEVKNLNSFRYLQKALEYEIERHVGVVESGGRVLQETRHWNQAESHTVSMRSKEKAHDYRYFPEPDLLPVHVSAAWRGEVRRTLPELPEAKRERFASSYGITPYDAEVLTTSRTLADYFEAVVAAGAPGKSSANWILTELLGRLSDARRAFADSHIEPAALAELVQLVESGKITGTIGKKVFATMFDSGRSAAEIVAAEGLGAQVGDSDIEQAAREIIAKEPANVAKFKAGNQGVFKFFVGQVMKATRGQASPQAVNDILRKLLA
ncbi:MAG TPA: Asp-tRNA(Asn)/Glu-tRNA(Gln) amidotransferase subunit GatB, partial [Candidatus Dormibacteraeota bacterium]|nr:Asp-tRNA(Asn)/Glu-tRNA(Gln) amidotransferase subunit GatB [Candidatus Dormibacteraeota bacterium]